MRTDNRIDDGVRPLVLRWGSFGDLIMLTPILKALAERAGEPVDLLAAGPWSEPMFTGSPWVGRVWSLDGRSLPNWLSPAKRALIRELRKRPHGPFWVFDSHPQARKFGEATRWPADAVAYPDVSALPERVVHAADNFWQYAEVTPPAFELAPLVKPARWQWELPPPEGAAADCARWLDTLGVGDAPLICVQAGNRKTMRAGSPSRPSNPKNWPTENWLAMVRSLRDIEPDAFILLIGAPSEAPMVDTLAAQATDPRVLSVAGQMTIARLLALLRRARGLVSVDTGPAHAAAANDCPVVVLFGPSDPRTCSPQGDRVATVSPPQRDGFDWQYSKWEPLSMSAIRVDDVISAWQGLT